MIPLLSTSSTVLCPHGGQALLASSKHDLLIDGASALLQSDVHAIVGCPFAPVAPSPCVSIRWLTGATQTAIHQVPVLLQNSVGLCLNAAQVPQGMAIVVQTQTTAKGL
ncbi:MAG: hypothetical protein V4795_16950 [Pseudomonadota bacterium]|jgi:hypothetical protein